MARRLRTDPETAEGDLVQLVLMIVKLLRQLMERAALHRVDQGDLSGDHEERVDLTLLIDGAGLVPCPVVLERRRLIALRLAQEPTALDGAGA